jgi:hypothetical protein
MRDEILEEIYAAKKKIAEECDYDFKKLLARYERMQAENPEGLVYEVPKTAPEPQQT